MSDFDEYINSLDGKENVDPLEVTRKLSELHKHELGIHEAKVNTLETEIKTRDERISTLDSELVRQKARNYDLDTDKSVDQPMTGGYDIDPSEVTIESLFKRKGR